MQLSREVVQALMAYKQWGRYVPTDCKLPTGHWHIVVPGTDASRGNAVAACNPTHTSLFRVTSFANFKQICPKCRDWAVRQAVLRKMGVEAK